MNSKLARTATVVAALAICFATVAAVQSVHQLPLQSSAKPAPSLVGFEKAGSPSHSVPDAGTVFGSRRDVDADTQSPTF